MSDAQAMKRDDAKKRREAFIKASTDISDRTLEHELVQEVIKEQYGNITGNHGAEPEGLIKYGLYKIAAYAAQVARAHTIGFDPNLLRCTDEEALDRQIELMASFLAADKEVFIVHPDE